MRLPSALLLSVLCLTLSPAWGEDWPAWRGPRGDGTSMEASAATKWNGETGEGVVWKVPVPGVGHSSPIVHGQNVFVTTCLLDDQKRELLCFDTESGDLRWQKTVIDAPLEKKHKLNSFASGTPATDGSLVYVTFLENTNQDAADSDAETASGNMVVAAYDFDGNQEWLVRPGQFSSVHGYCSSPLLFESLVIVNGDHDGDSYVVALDRNTGQTVWKTPRRHKTRSYVTPLLREVNGQPHIVFSGSKQITSLNPRDGSTWWTVEGPTEQFVASMVDDADKYYMSAGFPTHHVMGIRKDGSGDVTDTHVAWHSTEAKSYVPSPVVAGNHLYVADDRGIAHCFNTETGEQVWRERMSPHFSASLVTTGSLVYFLSDEGVMTIVRSGDAFDVVSENPLGQRAFASPAISNGQIYLRGETDLFRIGNDKP
ncbi:outer membrane protein assembly factor BamB family protein [Stieleria varia]|uniref:Outer membrane biogenesis protein BamB n=1 Tax=Stieleria varia TaxID=2528005 RepID=A0A5C6ANB8_9BACT|nr:PQQ-binding-like beta-propeller repeat protein [Stieleria varia]TWU00998.1 outer membrane biogenesis protein BamB [Stieleria varia]